MPYQTIEAKDGSGSFQAYVAKPKGDKSSYPAIIMIQEIFGVNAEMRKKCDLWAEKGYIAIAPDLFWRQEPGVDITDQSQEEWDKAFKLFNGFDVDKGVEDLNTTLEFIRNDSECNGKVGNIGYCLGGKLSYLMATRTDVDASVSYYGVGIQDMLDEADKISAPLLMHIAEKDEFVPKDAQAMIIEHFADKDEVQTYSYDADHAFTRINGVHYDETCARHANSRTEDFIAAKLGN